MTPEQLLCPRYKVIDIWPGMEAEPFHLGQIVTLQPHKEEDAKGFIHIPIKHIPRSYMWQSFFDLYKNLFQPLQWWQDRQPADMPECVKVDNIIHKATWTDKGGIMHMGIEETDWEVNANVMGHFEPATKEEYQSYINKNNPNE